MNRGEAAYNFFLEGYNCTQSVLMAYKDFFEKDCFSLILDSSSSFGGGMGRLREVCGTVSGAFLILGRVYGYHEAKESEKKAKLYSHIQCFASLFEKENSSITQLLRKLGINQPKHFLLVSIEMPNFSKISKCCFF